ncbi:MAG: peptidoglycan-binding protein [Acidimicrobiaceae bacterium]|nr:peptidoglycan-binding protein [Acidimicrobiaceae bacterium]
MRGLLARVMLLSVIFAGVAWMTIADPTPAGAAASCTGGSVYYNQLGWPVAVPTIGSNTHNDNCELGVGNTSNGVRALQITLNGCYGQHLALDGIYGPLTRAAVVYAQRHSGDPVVDGIYGPQTGFYLRWVTFVTGYFGNPGTCARLPFIVI